LQQIGGSNELIQHDRSGFIVAPADSDALAGAISQLLQNPTLRAALGQAARQRVEAEYSAEAVAKAHDRLYQNLLDSVCAER
jgi:glycosyltransferase involved in cell wall biosynthesis